MISERFSWFFCFCGLLALHCTGCGRDPGLVVYADPWCGDYAAAVVAAFEEAHPDTEVELRVLSTEVILQHLHFGQPIDVAIVLDSSLVGERGLDGEVLAWRHLADADLYRVRRKGPLNAGITGAGGLVVEATGRPLRTWSERWLDLEGESLLVANFYKQARDYVLRGWGEEGVVLGSMVREYAPKTLEVKASGPAIPGGFMACQLKMGRDAAVAGAFMAFLDSEKSRELLVDYHLIL